MNDEPPDWVTEDIPDHEMPLGIGMFTPPNGASDVYDYSWSDGSPAFKVVRFNTTNGHDKKRFQQWSIGESGWEPKQHVPAGKRPLYGELKPSGPVIIVEGEKTRNAASLLFPDISVVTWAGGASAAKTANWSVLKDRDIRIWPDNDPPGHTAAATIKEILPHAHIVAIPFAFPEGWDLADEVPDGFNLKTLIHSIKQTVVDDESYIERPPKKDDVLPPLAGVLDHLSWSDTSIPVRKWIVDGIIPARVVTLLQGDGGLGKSLLTLQLTHACATGRSWLGQVTRPCRVLAIYCEDDGDEIHRRLHDINSHFRNIPDDDLPGHIFADLEHLKIASRVGMENLLMFFEGADIGAGKVTELLYQIEAAAEDHGAELIILDSLHDLFGGNENNRVQARQFINGLQRIAIKRDGAVILNAHPSKSGIANGDGSSGSTAWSNSVRSRLYMARTRLSEDTTRPTGPLGLEIMKANYAAVGDRIELKWVDGFFEPQNLTISNDPIYKKAHCDTTFIDCLREVTKQNRIVTDSANASTFAPKIFQGLPCARGFTKNDFKAAMDRLFADGRIIKDLIIAPSRHKFMGIVEVKQPQKLGGFEDI